MAIGFGGYEVARSGMFVNERGLYVTGHNISNLNTAGYVRQQAMSADSRYSIEGGINGFYQIGLGADIQQIRQIRHKFLDGIYRQENTSMGYWEAKNKTFQDVEAILGEPMGAGLQNVMNQFYDSWQELSKEPDSLTVRALVRQRSDALVQHVNHLGEQLGRLQSDLNSEIKVRIDEINKITRDISNLNVTILKTEVTGDTANDYRDQRNNLVDRLTHLADVQVQEMQDGQLDVTLGGYFLVSKGVQKNLYAGESAAGGLFYVPKLEGTDIAVPVHSGTLKGLMEARGEVLGSKGSIQNGSPNTKADVVFAVDVSDSSTGYLSTVACRIQDYVNELKKSGLDYNVRVITYGNNTATLSYGTDISSLEAVILSAANTDTGDNFGGSGGVIDALEALNAPDGFRDNANRYAVVFTAESIDGDGMQGDAATYVNRLKALDIHTSVVTSNTYMNSGDPSTEGGWKQITEGTDGSLQDINTSSDAYADMLVSMAAEVNTGVNQGISLVESGNNVISSLNKKLNALVNIFVREVNYLHKSGMTLGGSPVPGQDLFVAKDPKLPLEMGNLKLNANLMELSNIVASESGKSGDNSIALKIANLRNVSLLKDISGTLSTDEYYQAIIQDIGHSGADSARIYENQQKLVDSADSYRKSVSGVSMDEEMTNMMKYKFAYNASSRAINVIDEMMETIITRLGLAGR